jgi:hypothetical protein
MADGQSSLNPSPCAISPEEQARLIDTLSEGLGLRITCSHPILSSMQLNHIIYTDGVLCSFIADGDVFLCIFGL